MHNLKTCKIRQSLYAQIKQRLYGTKLMSRLLRNKEKIVEKMHEYRTTIEANVSKSYRQEVYRKTIHLSSLWIPTLIYFAPTWISLLIFSVLLAGDILIEYGNFRRWHWARVSFSLIFGKSLRNEERSRIHFVPSGGVYVLSSALMCTIFFIKPVAVISLTVMLVSDTMAALVGKAIGQRKIYKQKSLEGTNAFFLSALAVNMIFEPIYHFTYVSVIACAAATIVELFEDQLELDDNLAIPLSVGAVLTLLA